MIHTFAAALSAALTVTSTPAPSTVAVREPAPIVETASNQATTAEKVSLAVLSLVDITQTELWLHIPLGPHQTWGSNGPREENPLLGAHPTLVRMALTGVALDEVILHVRSPFLRRLSIGIEAANVARNFSIGMKL